VQALNIMQNSWISQALSKAIVLKLQDIILVLLRNLSRDFYPSEKIGKYFLVPVNIFINHVDEK